MTSPTRSWLRRAADPGSMLSITTPSLLPFGRLWMPSEASPGSMVVSIFEFVADQGKLTQWYEYFVANFREDATGGKAFELCFDMPLDEIERAWRRWLTTRPKIDTTIDPGDASLGIQSRPNGSNDGVVIDSMLPGSAARRSQLRVGDVIVSIDGVPGPERGPQPVLIR